MKEIPGHEEDHAYIKTVRASSEERKKQWFKILWTVITTLIIGVATSLLAIIGYAAKAFVDRGGQ